MLRIGEPDLFLDGALLSLGDTASVHRRAARDVEATRASWSQYDAVIFDGVVPSPAPRLLTPRCCWLMLLRQSRSPAFLWKCRKRLL